MRHDRKRLLEIKEKLENEGTEFDEYYSDFIYKSGPRPVGFFKNLREENYSVDILVIPDRFYKLDEDQLDKWLDE